MFPWFKHKDRLEQLKGSYCKLMKRAYKLAPTDKAKSDILNKKAHSLLEEIHRLEK